MHGAAPYVFFLGGAIMAGAYIPIFVALERESRGWDNHRRLGDYDRLYIAAGIIFVAGWVVGGIGLALNS